MISFLTESVVISFSLGGVVGAIVTMHLVHPNKAAAELSEQAGEGALDP
jgi:hypothetical protein